MYKIALFSSYNDEYLKNLIHMFCIVYKNERYYWIENNLLYYTGNHGPFISEEVAINYVVNKINIVYHTSGLFITKYLFYNDMFDFNLNDYR